MNASSAWYSTEARIAFLDTAARAWEGTPFRANSAVIGEGGGVSCHNLVAELHIATGCIPRRRIPTMDPAALLHCGPDYLQDQVTTHLPTFLPLSDDPISGLCPIPGDLMILRYGRTCHHLVTMLSAGLCVHVLRHTGVIITPYATLFSHLRHARVSLASLRRPSSY